MIDRAIKLDTGYRAVVEKHITDDTGKIPRGSLRKLASNLKCDPSFLSHYLKEKCEFSLDHNQKLVRSGGIVCGQAIVSAADTVMIVAVTAAIGGYEQITTVDISCKFLRPLLNQGALIRTEMVKVGKLLVVGRIIVTDNKSKKIAAEISCTYARI